MRLVVVVELVELVVMAVELYLAQEVLAIHGHTQD
jgi:hypothetical protein